MAPIDLFISRTTRSSLGFDGRRDNVLWSALDLVGLKDFAALQEPELTLMLDSGSNYSVGRRQLPYLAAAILRSPRILVLDEATASIDADADVAILEECDKVLVMEQGMPIEYAPPREHLSQPEKLMAAARNSD